MHIVLFTDLWFLNMKYHYHYGLLNQFSTMNPFIDPIPAPISQLLGRTVVINIVLVMNTAETLITWRQTTNKSTNDKYNDSFSYPHLFSLNISKFCFLFYKTCAQKQTAGRKRRNEQSVNNEQWYRQCFMWTNV